MKTKLMILNIALISLVVWNMQAMGQQDPYTNAMMSAIELMEQVLNPVNLQRVQTALNALPRQKRASGCPIIMPPTPLFR